MRKELTNAIDAYDLAATPQPSAFFRDIPDDVPPDHNDGLFTDNRQALLNYSIDIKSIFTAFLLELIRNHGEKRAERFIGYTMTGYPERYTYAHRQQIVADNRRLKQIVANYKRQK